MSKCLNCGAEFEDQAPVPTTQQPWEAPFCPQCREKARPIMEAPRPPQPAQPSFWSSPTRIIIAINLLAYIAVAFKSHAIFDFDTLTLMQFGANHGGYALGSQPWRLLTATFLHGGLAHFALNMWALYNLGLLAELLFGAEPFLYLYLACGLSGSIASCWWHPTVIGVGASGAIFGIAGALLPALAFHPNDRLRAALRGTLASIGFFVVANLYLGFKVQHVDNAAHLGGLIAGLALGFALPSVPALAEALQLRRLLTYGAAAIVLLGSFLWVRHQRINVVELAHAADKFRVGDYAHALPYVQRAVSRDPKLPIAQFMLGDCYFKLGDNAHAAEALRRGLALEPSSADAHCELCNALLLLNKKGEALVSCLRAVQLAPREADKLTSLGTVEAAIGDNAAALRAFRTAVELNPKGVNENYLYARALLQDGQIDAAIPYLERAQKLKPTDREIATILAKAQAAQLARARR